MFSVIDWKTSLIGVFVLMLIGVILYFNHLQGKVSDLERELQLKEQKKQALAGSLEVVKKNFRDSTGKLRELRSRVNTPVDEDDDIIGDEDVEDEIGDAESRTDVSFALESDSVSGNSKGEKTQDYWEHDITKSAGLYNFRVHLKVWPPGDSVDYQISASTNEIRLSFYQYEDNEGIQRTGIDSPVELNFSGLDTYYRPQEPRDSGPEFENVKFELPLAKASNITGLTIGGGITYRTGTFLGMRALIRGRITTPIPGAPQPKENLPVVMPEVETAITF